MSNEELTSACGRCGALAGIAAHISPLGRTPGKHVFYCASCKHYTWIDFSGPLVGGATTDTAPVQQQPRGRDEP